MEVEPQLTTGAIKRILAAEDSAELEGFEPILQALSVKPVNSKPGEPPQANARHRLIASDGQHFAQCMLATQHNPLIHSGQIGKHSILKFTKFHANNLTTKKNLIVVMDLEVIGQIDEKIGDPKNIEHTGAAPSNDVPSATVVGSSSAGPSTSTAPSATAVNPSRRPAPTTRPPGSYPIYPIEQLSPYQNKWTIKARCTQKSDIRNFSTQRGEGKLFNVNLVDESGEIRATGFNAVVDELYDKFKEGSVYFISKAKVNIAKKKFGNLNNDFEIALEKTTEVEECLDADSVPDIKYNFVELPNLGSLEKDSMVDVVGVVSDVGDLQEFTTKAGKPLTKRDVTLADRSGSSVRLTFWGKQAETFSATDHPVMAFKGVKVGEFNNARTLSMVSSSTFQENPSIPESNLLRGWYDSEGHKATFQNLSAGGGGGGGGGSFRRNELMTLHDIKESNMGHGEQADFFSCRGTIIFIKGDNVMYTACPGDKCNKKVTEDPSGGWRCEKCDRVYPEPDPRYLMTVHVADHTEQLWLQAFNDVAQTIIGRPAKELYDIIQDDPSRAQSMIEQGIGKIFNFGCRARQDTYNDQSRVRYGINRVFAPNYAEEGRAIIDILKAY